MNTAVRYFTRTGNTRRIANIVAAAAGCRAESIEIPIEEPVDLLFLGGAVYWGGIPRVLKEYMKTLSPEQVERIAVFATAGMDRDICGNYQLFLKNHDLNVMKEGFFCYGKKVSEGMTKVEAGEFASQAIQVISGKNRN